MNNRWIVLMVVLPMAMGVLQVPLVQRMRTARVLGVFGFSATLITAITLLVVAQRHGGVLISQMGDWPAPFGITLVFDTFAGLMLCAASAVALFGYIASFSTLAPAVERRYYHPLATLLMMGVNLSFLTGDLFNLFVAFEIMLMASYGLLCVSGGKRQVSQAYKYVLLNLLASTLFVIAAGMVYGITGTLNMADLMQFVQAHADAGEALPTGFTAIAVLLLLVFGLKAAVFPLWFWLPDTYPTLPIPILAVFGGILTKVGIYAIARLFPPIFAAGAAGEVILPLLGYAAVLTMIAAALMAVAYRRLRIILCMLVVTGVGTAVTGVAVGTETALGGAAFYMTQSIIVAGLSFLICGQIERATGTDRLDRLGGLMRQRPWLAVAGFIVAMSMVGLPPLSGFYGKLLVVQGALTASHWTLGLAVLVAGTITLLALLRLWAGVFWITDEEPPAEFVATPGRLRSDTLHADTEPADAGNGWKNFRHRDFQGRDRGLWVAVTALLGISLWLGFAAQPVLTLAQDAGKNLADPQRYINAVLHNPAFARPDAAASDASASAFFDLPSDPKPRAEQRSDEAPDRSTPPAAPLALHTPEVTP